MGNSREYLGDSVYVTDNGYHICLTTDNGTGPTNIIYLEPAVWNALVAYMDRRRQLQLGAVASGRTGERVIT